MHGSLLAAGSLTTTAVKVSCCLAPPFGLTGARSTYQVEGHVLFTGKAVLLGQFRTKTETAPSGTHPSPGSSV